MKLTAAQIDQLYTFTRQHYVEWYDLQSELVDHLANAIESQWQENPELTFDAVLNKEFGKFGVYGFMDVVEEKQKFLGKKYRKLIWKYYKEFFRLPKIVMTFFLTYLLFNLLYIFQNTKRVLIVVAIVSMVVLAFSVLKSRRQITKNQKNTGKKWLFESIVFEKNNFLLIFLPSNLINIINGFYDGRHFPKAMLILISGLFILIGLYIFIRQKIIPKKVSEELEKTYPEYKLEKA